MKNYIIDRFRMNKNYRRERVFYTGVGIDFSRKISDAKHFDTLERARESVKYLNDCNMDVYIVEIDLPEESSDSEQEES